MFSCSFANYMYTWSDRNFCAISLLEFVSKRIASKQHWIKTTSFHYWTVLLFVVVYKVILSIESVDQILKGDVTGEDFITTSFSTTQHCEIVAKLFQMVRTLFQHCNAVLHQKSLLRIVLSNITLKVTFQKKATEQYFSCRTVYYAEQGGFNF